MKRLSIVIVNYNTKEILRDCLRNLSDKYEEKELIVVDNGSTDGSYEMIKSEFPSVLAIKSENRGLAHGYNLGVTNSNGDYVLFMGSDAYPTSGVLVGLVERMEFDGLVGASTAKLVLRDGKIDMDCHRGFPTPWVSFIHFTGLEKLLPTSKLLGGYFMGDKNLNTEHEIDLCISHFMLVKRQALNMVGPWDENFFVYGEDVDYCYRIKQSGWKIMYFPQFEVKHLKGASVGIRKETAGISKASPETKKKMRLESVKAMRLFYQKHMEQKYPYLINLLVNTGINVLEKLRSK